MDRGNMTKRVNSVRTWGKKPVAVMSRWGWAALVINVLALIALFWDWIWYSLLDWTWNWLWDELKGNDLSNFTVIFGAIIGISLALWRSTTAHKQANVAQRGLQNERFQKGADMLGSRTLATRIGGIYALERLAQDHPNEYHIQIMDLLCAFVRYPEIGYKGIRRGMSSFMLKRVKNPNPDIQEAMNVIGRRNQKQLNLDKKTNRLLDLSGTYLDRTLLSEDHLEEVFLMGAYLRSAILVETHLEEADLRHTHLEDANLTDAHLDRAKLAYARLQNAQLKGVKGLTQAMLDSAAHFYKEGRLLPGPDLERAFCAESGKELKWRDPPSSSSTSDNDDSNS